jgi:glycosyltransferase involved in cell wall biosynthesis
MDLLRSWIGIFLRPRPSTLHTHWPLEPLDGLPAVVHLFARLRKAFPDTATVTLGVVGYGGEPNSRIADTLRPFEVESYLSSLGAPPQVLAELCKSLAGRAQQIVLYPDNSVFPDCLLSREIMSYHESQHADATVCDEAPTGLVPVIYRVETILRIANLGLPGDASDDCLTIMRNANELLTQPYQRPFLIKSFPLPANYHSLLTSLPARVLVSNYSSRLAAEEVVRSNAASLTLDCSPALEMRKRLAAVRRFPPCSTRPQAGDRCTILFATNFAGYSGAEESFYQLIRGLDRSRYRGIALVSYEGVLSEKLRQAGIDVEVAYNDLETIHPDSFHYFAELLKYNEVRILHINSSAGIPLLATALSLKIPIVTHVRRLHGKAAPDWLNCSHAVVGVSDAVGRDLLRSGIDPNLVTTIYNGIDLDEFSLHGLHIPGCKAPAAVARKTVLIVARICREKRQELMVEAAAILCRKIPDLTVVFVGEAGPADQPYARRIMQLIRKLGLEKNVQFLGFRKRLQELYASSDAMVLCNEVEAFARCLLEALAMRVPVVVPSSGGHTELLSDGDTCVQFQPGDPESLARSIESVLCDGALSRRLAENGERLAKQLSIEGHVQRMCSLYERILREPRATDRPI